MNAAQISLYNKIQHDEMVAELNQAKAQRAAATNPKAIIMMDNMIAYLESKLGIQEEIAQTMTSQEEIAQTMTSQEEVAQEMTAQEEEMIEQLISCASEGLVVIPPIKAQLLCQLLTQHYGSPSKGARSTGPSLRTTYHSLRVEGVGSLRVTYHAHGATALIY